MTRYIRPSKCEQCVPSETITDDSYLTTITEIAHEADCPNNPSQVAA